MSHESAPDATEQKLQRLQAELGPLFEGDGLLYGHGTPTSEMAENILNVGLVTNYYRNLGSSVASLDGSREGLKRILEWPHKNHRYVVIVRIPGAYRQSPGELNWGERLFEELSEEDDRRSAIEHFKPSRFNKKSNAKLPSKYIAGYVDASEGRFVPNPAFEAELQIPDELPPAEERPLFKREKRADEAAIPPVHDGEWVEVREPSPESGAESEEEW